MKLIIFLICFIYILSLTSNYYKKCKPGVEYIDIVSVSSCRQYDNDDGYCCYLTYDNPKETYDIHIIMPPWMREISPKGNFHPKGIFTKKYNNNRYKLKENILKKNYM